MNELDELRTLGGSGSLLNNTRVIEAGLVSWLHSTIFRHGAITHARGCLANKPDLMPGHEATAARGLARLLSPWFCHRAKCDPGGRLSDLISCESQAELKTADAISCFSMGLASQGSTLDLYVAPLVFLPSRRIFRFLIQG